MNLPDFLEKLNQGAEKTFGEHAQAMIVSLLYAKLPPKLKRSVNMARLENATYEEIVTEKVGEAAQNAQKDFPRLVAMNSNPLNHRRENSVDSNQSEDDDVCDNNDYK